MPRYDHFFKKVWLRLISVGLMGAVLVSACQPSPASVTPGEPTPTPKITTSQPELLTLPAKPTPTPTTLPAPSVDPKNLNGITLQFWHPWSGALQGEVDAITAIFNQTNVWGIKVSVKAPGSSGALFDLLHGGLENGELPDVFASTTNQIFELQNNSGKVNNLDSYIFDSQWGLTSQEIADYPLIFWNSAQKGGQRLGIPAQRDVHVLFYNETWAKELGFFAPPDNPVAFRQQVCAAGKANGSDQDKANDGTGGWIINTDALTLLSWMMVFSEQKLPTVETESYNFNTPENQETYIYLRTLFENNCAWISRDLQPYNYFATRAALIYSGTLQDIARQARAQRNSGSTDQWKVIPYPAGERKPILLTSGTSYAMLKSSPEKQLAAWLFMRWMILPRNQVKIISATGLMPVNHSTSDGLIEYQNTYPQWAETLMMVPLLTEAPKLPSWRPVQNLIEDSGWQVFQTSLQAEQVADIPRQLDLMIADILKRR
jgi:multiple sugar transport system substrate-binding protein